MRQRDRFIVTLPFETKMEWQGKILHLPHDDDVLGPAPRRRIDHKTDAEADRYEIDHHDLELRVLYKVGRQSSGAARGHHALVNGRRDRVPDESFVL